MLVISKKQREGLEKRLDMPVVLGMRYGNPSIPSAVEELRRLGCENLLLFPLYPQFSYTTTMSTIDVSPKGIATIADYHKDEGYIAALANTVRETWAEGDRPDKLLMSFHGIPQRYVDVGGDPYPKRCEITARMLADALELRPEDWQLCYQSRFGKEPWLQPYTDETLKSWPSQGINTVDVVCPGFSADCLETIEEIDGENREYFEEAGGRALPLRSGAQ